MSPRTKLIIGGVVNFALLVNPILAQLPPISFESPTYVAWDPIDSYDPTNWHVQSGSAQIGAAGSGYGGGQALTLRQAHVSPDNFQEAWLRRDIAWNATEQTAFIDFKIKPAAEPEGSLASFVSNGSQLAFQVSSSSGTGQLWAFSGGDGGGSAAQWFLTPGAFPVASGSSVSSSWMRVTLRHDYARNLWDLFIDGKLAAVNLAFEGRGPNLASLEFFGSHHGDTNLDDLSVDPANMLFPDADKDGLPDAWETANGSNPNVYDRDDIKPGTGKSFLDSYLDSLWPPSTPVANGLTGIGSLGTIPPLTIMGDHVPVGALKGSFSVGGDGAASYSIPIDLPKGTGGMEPKLALAYSSSNGNGVAGLGFSLSGLQAITRGKASFKKDGFAKNVDLADDRFFLNGEKLVCINGIYGADGSEYRTEIDSFSRIRLIGDANTTSSSWKVETKAGLILEFGGTADSRLTPSGSTAPLSWGVSKVADTVSNYYSVIYETDTALANELVNDRVKEIQYTGNTAAGLSPYCTISFTYETRPDPISAYSKGNRMTSSKRLKEIGVSTGSFLNHRYELTYGLSPQTKRSILTSVQKFTGTGASLPATTINWQQKADPSVRERIGGSATAGQNQLEWKTDNSHYSKFIDLNGDGLLDRVDHRDYVSGEDGLWVSLNNGNGFSGKSKWYTGGYVSQNLPEWKGSHKFSGFLDMNGDGLPDRVDHANYATNQPGVWVSLNTGSGFADRELWWSSTRSEQSYIEWASENGRFSGFIDLNDDGLPDKVDHCNYSTNELGIWVSLNTGSGFAAKTRWYVGGTNNQNLFEWRSGQTMYSGFVDMNGDRLPDRVDHRNYATGEYGLWVSLNTGSDFEDAEKWYTGTTTNQNIPEWYTSDGRASGLIDMNGDGLPDRVDHRDYQTSQPGLWVSINQGDGFAARELWYESSNVYQNIPSWNSGQSVRSGFFDMNGDGLPDRVDHYDYTTNQPGMWVSLNTGKNYAPKSKWYTATTANQNAFQWGEDGLVYSNLVDMNADGLPDRVDHYDYQTGVAALWVSLNTGSSFSPKTIWYQSTKTEQNYPVWGYYGGFIDLNSDGLPDRLDHYNYSTSQYGFWVSMNKGTGYNGFASTSYSPEVISSITDGFGSEIQVEYKRLNDPTPVTAFGGRVYEKGTATLPAGQIAYADGRLVVSRYSEEDGLGGRRYKSQRYGDLRHDRVNQVSLGFGWTETIDEMTGQRSRTEMMREYPFAGSPAKMETFAEATQDDLDRSYPGATPGLRLITRETSQYAELASQVGVGGTIRRPVQIRSDKWVSDINGDPVTLGTIKSYTITQQLLADFDSYGFVKKSTVTSLDGTTVVTESDFTHTVDASRWHLGRLSTSTVTKSGAGRPTLVKTAAFTYSGATGLLESETVQPADPLSVTKSYSHDAFGNVESTTVTASGQSRSSSTEYDAQGRFPVREENQLGHAVTHQYDSQKSLLLSSNDIAGRTSWFHYDAFNTLIRTDLPDGTQSGEITGFATNASLPTLVAAQLTAPSLPPWSAQTGVHTIKYFRAKESSAAPPAKVYLDKMGRELVSETTILRDATASGSARYSKIYVVNVYDVRARKIATSLPFAEGETVLWTTYSYDSFDRIVNTSHPDGQYDYVSGHTTGLIAPVGLDGPQLASSHYVDHGGSIDNMPLSRAEDEHGRLIASTEALGLAGHGGMTGNVITYHHDHEGRLVNVKMNGRVLLENTYDIFGNKTKVEEANSGISESGYNGFGEVVWTKNAKGQFTYFTYDALGRQASVAKPEGTYNYYYDHARGSGLGKPWKTTGPSGYEEEISYDSFGRPALTRKTQFGETFTTAKTYDVLGRTVTSTDAGGVVTLNGYDPVYSFPVSITLAGGAPGTSVAGAGTVLWEAGTYDSSGRVLSQTLAQGVETSAEYNLGNGLVTKLTGKIGSTYFQDKRYQWEGRRNLEWRHDALTNRYEYFTNDHLNRLLSASVSSSGGAVPSTESYTYDGAGNLLTKGSGTALTYGAFTAAGPHQVQSATVKGFNRTYTYDAAGYVTNDSKRVYTWTSFGQLATLSYASAPKLNGFSGVPIWDPGNIFTSFDFDAAGNRARQVKERQLLATPGQFAKETTLYLGSYEREIHEDNLSGTLVTTKTVHRHSFGSMVYTRSDSSLGSTTKLTAVLKDYLGSTDALLVFTWGGSAFGAPAVENQAFDAWGERQNFADLSKARTNHDDPFVTSEKDYDRGYTGHEQLDDSGLIHMNGRIYDPEIGRMLSPDPFVQVPEASQNFNRYSYVMNNPVNATDPSGYLFMAFHTYKKLKWAKNNWDKIGPYVGIVVAVVLAWTGVGAMAGAAITGAAVGSTTAAVAGAGMVGALMGGVNSAMAGGDWGDILRGVAVGGVQAGITAGVLHGMGVHAGSTASGIDDVAHVVGHGVVGGATNVAMGGKFSDGFLAAAAGASAGYLMGMGGISITGDGLSSVAGRTAIAGIVGGTVSAIGGGKFANGFRVAAFQHLFNYELITAFTAISENTLNIMDPTSGRGLHNGVSDAQKGEKMADWYRGLLDAAKGKTSFVKAFSKKGGGELLDSLQIETNIGSALFKYFVEVPAALVDLGRKEMFIGSLHLDSEQIRPVYLMVERTTVEHNTGFWGNKTSVTKDYFIVPGAGGRPFKNLQEGINYYSRNRISSHILSRY